MTQKIDIIDPKAINAEQAHLLGIAKDSAKWPYDDILRGGVAPSINARPQASDEAHELIKKEQQTRRRNKIPLKAKEILITKSKTAPKNDIDGAIAGEAKLKAKDVDSDSALNMGTETDPSSNDKAETISKSADSADREVFKQEVGADKQSDRRDNSTPLVGVVAPLILEPNSQKLKSRVALGERNTGLADAIKSVSLKQNLPQTDAQAAVLQNIGNKNIREGNASSQPQHKGNITKFVEASLGKPVQENANLKSSEPVVSELRTKKTMQDLTRKDPVLAPKPASLSAQEQPGVRSSEMANRERGNPATPSGKIVENKDQTTDRLQSATSRSAPQIGGLESENTTLHSRENKWSHKSSHIPPRLAPERTPRQKSPIPEAFQNQVIKEKPLNSRIGNSFPVNESGETPEKVLVAKQSRSSESASAPMRPVAQKANGGTQAPISSTDSINKKNTSETAAGMSGQKTSIDPRPETKALESNPPSAVLSASETLKENLNRVKQEQQVLEDANHKVNTLKTNIIGVTQMIAPKQKITSLGTQRREKFQLPVASAQPESSPSRTKQARSPRHEQFNSDLQSENSKYSNQKTDELNEADALKMQLRERIEVLKKAQESSQSLGDQSQNSSLDRGLSARQPGNTGFMPGDTRFVSPRTNPPVFAKHFSEELIAKIREVQSLQDVSKGQLKTSFVVQAGRLGNIDIEFKQESGKEQITVYVDSETSRNDLQKVMPQIEENLNQKGFEFSELNVEIRNSSKDPQFDLEDDSSSNSNERDQGDRRSGEVNEDPLAHDNRKYGYNTMEVLA